MVPNILSIAGSDPSGGAGIQADIKTIGALGGYACTVLTVLTAQNTQGVLGLEQLSVNFIEAQLHAIDTDLKIDAVKIGVLGNTDAAISVANWLKKMPNLPVVLDPVMVATSGDALNSQSLVEVWSTHYFPRVALMTPNCFEAGQILGRETPSTLSQMKIAAQELHQKSSTAVLLTGGHLKDELCVDIFYDGQELHQLTAKRVHTNNTHGTGCTLSSAIATYLGRGEPMFSAITKAKAYVTRALEQADQLTVGQGHGPLNHHLAV